MVHLIGIPLESSNDKDSQILSLAPSRGTGFTFSDMASIYQVMDDAEPTLTSTTMTTYTATDYSKATGMRLGTPTYSLFILCYELLQFIVLQRLTLCSKCDGDHVRIGLLDF